MPTEDGTEGLLDTIHKCLMCDKEAYEYAIDEFRCSDKNCDFKWKVINCGKKLL